jgi:diguanylate cyclase (GGDEF)-like protein
VSDHLQSLSRRGVDEILRVLDQALDEHAQWLTRWHRIVLSAARPPKDIVSENAHYLTKFGAWYDLHKEDGLVNQAAFHGLATAHKEMLEHAAWLAARAWKNRSIPPDEYDAFMDKVGHFSAQVKRVEKAFRAALSDLDPLTGVHNRQNMLRELAREQDRAKRTGQPCTLALGDLDRFKSVNDTHGHVVGDQVLLAAAHIFMSGLRPYDAIFRYGGEEFLFCLPDTNIEQAARTLDRLRQRLADHPIPIEGLQRLYVTASFGLTEMSPDIAVESLIERADRALYAAKQGGRNRVEVWRSADPEAPSAPSQ